jgi:hypothetical protein
MPPKRSGSTLFAGIEMVEAESASIKKPSARPGPAGAQDAVFFDHS